MWFLEKEEQELINKLTSEYPFTSDTVISVYLNSGRLEVNVRAVLNNMVACGTKKKVK